MLYTHMTDEALVVGARNILYKLSVDELRLKQTLTWNSVELDRDSCLVKGKVSPMRFHEIFVLRKTYFLPKYNRFCRTRFDVCVKIEKEIFQLCYTFCL